MAEYNNIVPEDDAQVAPITPEPPPPPRRIRRRKESLRIDRDKVAEQAIKDLDRDLADRLEWNEARVQRFAKLHGIFHEKTWPWLHASNAHIPIMQTDSLRMQDSIFNAVMTSLPPISSRALSRQDQDKQDRVDGVIYHQVFLDQPGEEKISVLANQFVDDGVFLCYAPWVKTRDRVSDTRAFDPIPTGMLPRDYVVSLLQVLFQNAAILKVSQRDREGWAWAITVQDQEGKTEKILVDAYVEEDGQPLTLEIIRSMETFNGPVMIPKAIEDYAVPFRCANVQPPSAANPGGAQHVILLDYPTLDELKRLKKSGFYDLVTDEELEAMAVYKAVPNYSSENDQLKQAKDVREGTQPTSFGTEPPAQLTRLTEFTRWDINGDGLEEDVIFWVIKETQTTLKAKLLTEMYPAYPPRRPLIAKAFIPIPDRFYGISLPELLEPLYDTMKVLLDQGIDAGTLRNMPWGLIRAHSGLRNELVTIDPGTFVPTANPRDDLFIPQFGNQGDAWIINMLTLIAQWGDEQTMIGQLQLGRVPEGRASALRTVGGMLSILQQGDARPEHILRRFFSGLSEIWAHIHEMNQKRLPKRKEFLMVGVPKPGEDVYQSITDRQEISGRFQFEFRATVLNTSKGLLQQSLSTLLSTLVNPLLVQLGMLRPDGVYRLFNDWTKSLGQDATRYLTPPSPGSSQPSILWQEAVQTILNGQMPEGMPLEVGGAQEHLNGLVSFMQSDEFGLIRQAEGQLKLFEMWLSRIRQLALQEQQQAQLMQAITAFQQTMNNGQQSIMGQGMGQPGQQGTGSNPMVNKNELMTETLPSSGGGASIGRPA